MVPWSNLKTVGAAQDNDKNDDGNGERDDDNDDDVNDDDDGYDDNDTYASNKAGSRELQIKPSILI